MNYAVIDKEGKVTNIISIHPINVSDFCNTVNTQGLPVNIGDTYLNGAFLHNGEVIKPVIAVNMSEDMLIHIKNEAIAEVQKEVQEGATNG